MDVLHAQGVVEPMMNGLGGDIMVLVWDEDGRELHGYNGAGRAPAGQSLEDLREGLESIGEEYIPMRGPLTVTVWGLRGSWALRGVRQTTTRISAIHPLPQKKTYIVIDALVRARRPGPRRGEGVV